MSLYYNSMNMINKGDIVIFKKEFTVNNSVVEYEFMTDDYLNSYSRNDEALVIVRLFNTSEVRLMSGKIIIIPIDNSLYEVYPCIKSLQILQEYFEDQGDLDKYDLVSVEILARSLEEALEQYEECGEQEDDILDNVDFYYTKRNLIKIATNTMGTACEKRGKDILQMITT